MQIDSCDCADCRLLALIDVIHAIGLIHTYRELIESIVRYTMSTSLRPTSVCDTTPLQRFESQSSNSEPSSPTLNHICNGTSTGNSNNSCGTTSTSNTTIKTNTTVTIPATTTTTNKFSLATNQHNNNNKIEIHFNHFMNSSGDTSEKSEKMKFHGTSKIFSRIFLDLLILSCVAIPIVGFHLWGESFKRGFFCDDTSLKHPYKDSTVDSWMLYLMGFVVPVALITLIEFFISNSNKMHGIGNLSIDRYYFCHLELPDWLVECYKRIGILIFGAGVGQLTMDVAKYSIGRLRPHFFAVCQPIMYDGTTCADEINTGRYIEEFTCRAENITSRILKEVTLSFPSGHANFSFYTMMYIAIYLHKRMTWQRMRIFKHLLQFFFLMFAWYAALTRVSDYKHHWSDVLAGSLIGTTYAIVVTSSMW